MKQLLLIILFFFQIVTSQTAGKYSNEFLSIGFDAKALGMGKSVIDTSQDANSTYWKTVGLLSIKGNKVSLMHAEYFAGIAKYDFAAYALTNIASIGNALYSNAFSLKIDLSYFK